MLSRANLRTDISALIYHVRAAGSGAAELQIENTYPFFSPNLEAPRAYTCLYICADVYTCALRWGVSMGGGGEKGGILDVGSGAPKFRMRAT